MAKIITVHGTFASGPAHGEKWWQRGSEFESHMRELVDSEDGELKYEPYIWNGYNSETSRRNSGSNLYDDLAEIDKTGEKYCIIGHSHGGSVISASLLESSRERNRLSGLQSWISIGTPFIQTRRQSLLFHRLGMLGKTVYVALMTFLAVGILVLYQEFSEHGFVWQALLLAPVIFATPFLLFYAACRYAEGKRLHMYHSRTVRFGQEAFQPKWLSLWHLNDEAIQGLRSLKELRLEVFNKSFAAAPLSFTAVFIVPLAALFVLSSPSVINAIDKFSGQTHFDEHMQVKDGILVLPNSINPAKGANVLMEIAFDSMISLTEAVGISRESPALIRVIAVLGYYFAIAFLLGLIALSVTWMINKIALGVSTVISRNLNPVAMAQIRATALGSDTREDDAIDARDWPMWLGKGFPPLPGMLSDELQNFSDAAVSLAVPKFRNAVRAFQAAATTEDKSDMISEYLTWDELIHTSYFKNAQFRKLIAFAITQCEGFKPTEAFQNDPEYAMVAGWYSDLKAHATSEVISGPINA